MGRITKSIGRAYFPLATVWIVILTLVSLPNGRKLVGHVRRRLQSIDASRVGSEREGGGPQKMVDVPLFCYFTNFLR